MDIYEYAMQMEKDGENFYRALAEKTGNSGIQNILIKLADAEVKHYKIFQAMKRNEEVEVTDTAILSEVRNIFVQMKDEQSFSVDVSQIALYKKAQDIETMTRDFYLEKAAEMKDPSQKEIFLKVAEEEKKHYFILENIISFVSQPESWLENPEWYHLEEY